MPFALQSIVSFVVLVVLLLLSTSGSVHAASATMQWVVYQSVDRGCYASRYGSGSYSSPPTCEYLANGVYSTVSCSQSGYASGKLCSDSACTKDCDSVNGASSWNNWYCSTTLGAGSTPWWNVELTCIPPPAPTVVPTEIFFPPNATAPSSSSPQLDFCYSVFLFAALIAALTL
jgi:hypothetical protein